VYLTEVPVSTSYRTTPPSPAAYRVPWGSKARARTWLALVKERHAAPSVAGVGGRAGRVGVRVGEGVGVGVAVLGAGGGSGAVGRRGACGTWEGTAFAEPQAISDKRRITFNRRMQRDHVMRILELLEAQIWTTIYESGRAISATT
jgi:hypothetical protein